MVIPNSNNLYNNNQLPLQLRCNDLEIYNKRHQLVQKRASIIVYIFYADRNVRPWMILGYTLATFPKVATYIFMYKMNKKQAKELCSHTQHRGVVFLLLSELSCPLKVHNHHHMPHYIVDT